MNLNDFDYELPEELIAQYPLEDRDQSRMILLDRESGEVRETLFCNLSRYLIEGELVVINETKVMPARLLGEKATGAKIELFLTTKLEEGRWQALARPSRRLKPGDSVLIGEEKHEIRIVEELSDGEWIVMLPEETEDSQFINKYGHVPLPPYIKRQDDENDVERYQTIFARNEGSVAAPTAGLHFTDKVLRDVERKGNTILPVTLHVGPGTFRPLDSDIVEDNLLESEFIMIRKDFWDEIMSAKQDGRGVIAVGTTVTRALEALASGRITDRSTREIDGAEYITGWTDLFIYPGFRFKVVDALLTNMHLPKSSLLVLVSAFTGLDRIQRTYKWAVQRRFRFYSYGDVMFIR